MTKIGVLVSGGGTNLQAVIDRVHHKSGEIAVVIANNADAYGLTRAQNSGIPTAVVLEKDFEDYDAFNAEIIRILKDKGVELVVLAGYMKIITPAFVEAYPNKIVNIHPALIPSFAVRDIMGCTCTRRSLTTALRSRVQRFILSMRRRTQARSSLRQPSRLRTMTHRNPFRKRCLKLSTHCCLGWWSSIVWAT